MAFRLTCTHSDGSTGWYSNKPAIDTYMLPVQRPRPPKQAHTCVHGGRLPCHSLGVWRPIRNPHRRTAMRPSSHSHKQGRVVAARQHEVSRQHVSSRTAEAGSRRRLDNKQAHTRTLSSHQFGWLCPTSSHAGRDTHCTQPTFALAAPRQKGRCMMQPHSHCLAAAQP